MQGIKVQSQNPENDENGQKSENFNFFGRNLFAMHKLALFPLSFHMKLEIGHFSQDFVYKIQDFGSKPLLRCLIQAEFFFWYELHCILIFQ